MATLKLIIMRHGEAEIGGLTDDHGRRLTRLGVQEAKATAAVLADRVAFLPTLLLVSDAARTRETAKALLEVHPLSIEPQIEPVLYHARYDAMKRRLASTDVASHVCVMLVGHNPGISDLVMFLTEQGLTLGTGEAVLLSIEASSWAEALDRRAAWELAEFIG